MTKENVLTEWRPQEGFNILDFRDFKSFPQYDPPPYVLKFHFSNIQRRIEVNAVAMDLMGWNIPECQTDVLFSNIQISKNGSEDIYYKQPGGRTGRNYIVFPFERSMVLHSSKDVLVITMFPLCPVHMVDIDQIVFLSNVGPNPTPTLSPVPPQPSNDVPDKCQSNLLPFLTEPKPITNYWYIYATIFGMIMIFLLSSLFRTVATPQRRQQHVSFERKIDFQTRKKY